VGAWWLHIVMTYKIYYVKLAGGKVGKTPVPIQAKGPLWGLPRLTADADITPAMNPDNLVRLARALRQLDARVSIELVPDGLVWLSTARPRRWREP
jgi:hypothetical protein